MINQFDFFMSVVEISLFVRRMNDFQSAIIPSDDILIYAEDHRTCVEFILHNFDIFLKDSFDGLSVLDQSDVQSHVFPYIVGCKRESTKRSWFNNIVYQNMTLDTFAFVLGTDCPLLINSDFLRPVANVLKSRLVKHSEPDASIRKLYDDRTIRSFKNLPTIWKGVLVERYYRGSLLEELDNNDRRNSPTLDKRRLSVFGYRDSFRQRFMNLVNQENDFDETLVEWAIRECEIIPGVYSLQRILRLVFDANTKTIYRYEDCQQPFLRHVNEATILSLRTDTTPSIIRTMNESQPPFPQNISDLLFVVKHIQLSPVDDDCVFALSWPINDPETEGSCVTHIPYGLELYSLDDVQASYGSKLVFRNNGIVI